MKMVLSSLVLALLLLAQLILGPLPVQGPVAVAPPSLSTEEAVRQAPMPWRDLAELAVRVKGVPPEAVYPARPAQPTERRVGDKSVFWVADQPNDSYFTINATLQVVTPHAYMWVADDVRADRGRLQEAAAFFEERIYSANRANFGEEQPVGLDGDPRVSIVSGAIPGLGGYFTSVDDYPRAVHQYSNERKAIYINVASAPVGSTGYYGILAHEFEHMIQWNTSRAEQTWVKEGSAEVAVEAADLGISSALLAFQARPDTQLTAWEDSKGDVGPHYGAAYLFISYFLEHYGGYQAGADLLTGDTRGPDSFDRFLAGRGYDRTFEDVFKDWVVANYLDDSPIEDPRFQYEKQRLRLPGTDRVVGPADWRDRTVRQFAADYVELSGRWSGAKIHFQGDQANRVVPARARSGRHFWWSNRGDMVDTRLTREFDLRGLSDATLEFWAWYDLEDDYDYAYVMVSRDGGQTWLTLPTTDTQTVDPNGNNLGNGFTGRSLGSGRGQWVRQQADLSAFTGEVVLLRFEGVTDDAYNAPGFAVDDVSIPELGYYSDAEEDGGWDSEGFVRVDGEIPQPFSLQLIRFGDDITVEQVPVSAGAAEVELPATGDRSGRAVLVVSGLSRYTTEVARYRYSVEMAR